MKKAGFAGQRYGSADLNPPHGFTTLLTSRYFLKISLASRILTNFLFTFSNSAPLQDHRDDFDSCINK